MNKRQLLTVIGSLVAMWLLIAGTLAASSVDFNLGRYVIAGGGGYSSSTDYTLASTTGQPDAGVLMSGGNYILAGGFWGVGAPAGSSGANDVYLPVLLKGS